MKKLLVLFGLISCGNEYNPRIEISEPLPEPTVIPTPIKPSLEPISYKEQASKEGRYMDYLIQVTSHEFGHAIGLLHPFSSPTTGKECFDKLKAKGYDLKNDLMWRGLIDEDEDSTYSSESIMNYSECKQGYLYNPYPIKQDLEEAYELLPKEDALYLKVPTKISTFLYFRENPILEVCTVGSFTDYQKALFEIIFRETRRGWVPSGWEFLLKDKCDFSSEEIRIEVINTSLSGNIILGYSYPLTFGDDKPATMGLVIPKDENEFKYLMEIFIK